MCMANFDDGPEFFTDSTQKARKAHKCLECRRVIEVGETYRRYFGVYEGSGFSGKICQHCEVPAAWLSENCGGYMFEAILEDFTEHVNEYQRMDIARVAVMARNKWRSPRRGVLLPVPKLPRPLEQKDLH
jgi:hypothetical protein